jgi:SAM-dependent methyltransferase
VGLARGAAALLLEESVRRPFSGQIATLGVQTLYMSPADLRRQFERFSVTPAVPQREGDAFDDKLLFRMLGFKLVACLDYSDFEGADHVVDLNVDGLPAQLRDKFDVVLDSGTLEHVFHIPHALKNIISLVKVGGRIIFLSPSSNHLDHGFYMFSPTFFADYFLANKFEINTCYVVRYSPNLDNLWDAYQYDPDRWRNLRIGGLDDKPYAIFFVVTRTAESTSGVIPQQNYYADNAAMYAGARLAERSESKAGGDVALGETSRQAAPSVINNGWQTIRHAAKGSLRRIPFAYRLAQRLLLHVDKKHLNKKLVGRY